MKRKITAIFACLCGIISAQTPIWNGTADASWYNDRDTMFYISTAEQLAGLAKLVNGRNRFKNKTIKLVSDIWLNDTTGWENWDKFPPKNEWREIGVYKTAGPSWHLRPFMGKFEGDGHFVYGMYIDYNRIPFWFLNSKGFFGWLSINSKVNDLGLSCFYIHSKNRLAGGIAGTNIGGHIESCAVKGIIDGNNFVGGISGATLMGNATANSVYVKVSGRKFVGGISGQLAYSEVSRNQFVGNVSGRRKTGILIGEARKKSVVVSNDFSCKDDIEVIGKVKRRATVNNNNKIQ